jgi:hypothetical protein
MTRPLQALTAFQRIGWIFGQQKLSCILSHDHWTAGKTYSAICEEVNLQGQRTRRTRKGVEETVTLVGKELMIRIIDDKHDWHRFFPNPTFAHRLVHSFSFLVSHFDIPAVPDIAEANPDLYDEYLKRLHALETSS